MVSTASSLAPSLRWGILATGWISQKFALDLLIAPSTRGVDDIASHKIAAVASRSVDSADSFVRKIWSEAGLPYDKEAENVKKLGSYEELYESDQIDVIYIGTPHSHHYRNAHDALSAGKSVVCEKPLTVNAAQAEVLVNLAKEKNVFLMEAVWTRMQPVAEEVQQIAKSGILGELRGVQAELCIDFEVENLDPSHRMVAPELAGGALLDLGPYPWTWLALLLLDTASNLDQPYPLPKISGSIIKWNDSVDLSTIAVIQFPQPNGKTIHGTMNCSMQRRSAKRVVIIEGSLGFIEINWAAYRPESYSYTVYASSKAKSNDEKPVQEVFVSCVPRPGNCWGFVYEQDEVARCLRDGKVQSEKMSWRDTILMMKVFDEIRRQNDQVFPRSIETTEVKK